MTKKEKSLARSRTDESIVVGDLATEIPVASASSRTNAAARVIVTRAIIGIAHMQVCAASDATDEEILAVCNRENPSGTSHGWSTVCRSDDEFWGPVGPVTCGDDATRTHFMVGC